MESLFIKNLSFINKSYFTSVISLNQDPNIVWKEKLNKQVRNSTRKALKSDLSFESDIRYLKDFYRLYKENMKIFGSPSHGLDFF